MSRQTRLSEDWMGGFHETPIFLINRFGVAKNGEEKAQKGLMVSISPFPRMTCAD